MEGQEANAQPSGSEQPKEVEMTDSNLRTLKIKSIDGQTYEVTVPKDVS